MHQQPNMMIVMLGGIFWRSPVLKIQTGP